MLKTRNTLILLALLSGPALTARADLAPQEETPLTFDGACICELACNASSLSYFQIMFHTDKQAGSTDSGTADLACQAEANVLRGLSSLKKDVTAKQATFHLCKFGGKDTAACGVDGACAIDKVECFADNMGRGAH